MIKPVTAMYYLQQILKPALIDLLQVLLKCPIETSAKQNFIIIRYSARNVKTYDS